MFAKAMNELDLDLEVFRYPAINKPAGVVHWTSRRDILLEYVKNVQPELMELFVKRAPQQGVDDGGRGYDEEERFLGYASWGKG
ncbi:hypothetical protein L2E82_36379 [Cichorium intybus]|uniref:Uncharacterized protein n=1 Tax=Cichorium intybus TaxID=13427 RepID=A0ACB9BRD5_CICIN|nr:hypothetical protein L2E82_36379 [Cichorium intybus]